MPETKTILYKEMKKKKPKKRKSQSRQALQRELDKVFNAYIRRRDGTCLMGKMFGGCSGYLTAGHVIPKEDSYNVRYLENNVFGQCSGHNLNHRYRRSKYNTWFIATHGEHLFAELSDLASQPAKVLNSDQLKEMITYYKSL